MPVGEPLQPQSATRKQKEQTNLDWRGTTQYEIVRHIGRGGMGVVYEAVDRARGRHVALKTLLSFDPASLYRFKQEFRALADVHHRNLVHLYELVVTEAAPVFFTMELVRGCGFLEHVCRNTGGGNRQTSTSSSAWTLEASTSHPTPRSLPLASQAQAVDLASGASTNAKSLSLADFDRLRPALRQLVEGLLALHAAGKLHRDIKPSNVLVTEEGRVVLLDFGVAMDLPRVPGDRAPNEPGIVGTPKYMSPEQALGETQTQASDWYSVGVMLYQALVGRTPFDGSAIEILSLKNTTEPPAPSECVFGVPADLDELCRALLHIDPAQRPHGREILRCLGSTGGARRDEPRSTSDAPPWTLVGREEQLRALRAAFESTRSGAAMTVRVGGRAGMGKSALVQKFLDDLIEAGEADVLCGRAYERESVPYKAVDGVVDALSRQLMWLEDAQSDFRLPRHIWALARLFPVLRRVPSISGATEHPISDVRRARRRAFEAFRETMVSLARRRPLVLFIDDVQWGDTDSVALLVELMRPPKAPPLLLIMTYREEEAVGSQFLAEMAATWPAHAEVRDIQVGPLADDEAQRLALSILAGCNNTPETAFAIAREASGSPLLVEELARAAERHAGHAALGVLTLEQMVSERLGLLPERARRLAETVAVAGRPVALPTIMSAAGLADDSGEPVTLLRMQRFVRLGFRGGQEVIEPIHDRIQETIVALLEPLDLRKHHAHLAAALETTPGADLEGLAVHWLGAGETQRGAVYAERAAEQAEAKLAFDQAARLFRLVLGTTDPSQPEAQKLRVRIAQALERAGRATAAADAYREAAQRASAIDRIELERNAAEQLVTCGRIDEGAVALRRVLAVMGMSAPASALGSVLLFIVYQLRLAFAGLRFRERAPEEVSREDRVRVDALRAVSAGLGTSDVILGACMQARHLLLAMRVGDRFQVLRALCVELLQFAVAGRLESKRERATMEAARGLAQRIGPEGERYFERLRGLALYMRGRFREALDVLDKNARGATYDFGSANVRLFAIYCCFYLGRLKEEAQRAERLLRDVEDRGDFYTAVCLRSTVLVDSRLAADDPEGARRHLREAMARWTQSGFQVQHWYAMASEANIELYLGNGPRAYERIARDARALKKSFLLHSRLIRGFTAYLRGCCAVASIDASDAALREERLREAERCAVVLVRQGAEWNMALAWMVRASIAVATDKRADAIESLQAAVIWARQAHMALHEWAASWRLGLLMGGPEGKALVAQAEDAMTREGVRFPARMAGLLLPGRRSPAA